MDEDAGTQSDKPVRKKQQRSLRTQQKLLDAAQEAFSVNGYTSARLDWLVETHLKPMFEAAERELIFLQKQNRAPAGDPAMLFNLIRVSAGGLFALSNEVMATSNLDMSKQSSIDTLADMIIKIFLPNDTPCED